VEGRIEQRPRVRAYRRLAAGISISAGIAAGIGLGGLAVLARSLSPILILGIPLGIRVFGTIPGRLTFRDRTIVWLWPIVALVVALSLAVLLPPGLAPFGLGIAVALWFTTLVVGGILEVVVDPEGRLGL
jgi:hypothetical protein